MVWGILLPGWCCHYCSSLVGEEGRDLATEIQSHLRRARWLSGLLRVLLLDLKLGRLLARWRYGRRLQLIKGGRRELLGLCLVSWVHFGCRGSVICRGQEGRHGLLGRCQWLLLLLLLVYLRQELSGRWWVWQSWWDLIDQSSHVLSLWWTSGKWRQRVLSCLTQLFECILLLDLG